MGLAAHEEFGDSIINDADGNTLNLQDIASVEANEIDSLGLIDEANDGTNQTRNLSDR